MWHKTNETIQMIYTAALSHSNMIIPEKTYLKLSRGSLTIVVKYFHVIHHKLVAAG